MGEVLPQYVSPEQAASLLNRQAAEFAVLRNPPGVWPDFELTPLAPKQSTLKRGPRAVLVDMDGTTTLTEDLCLHALETLVRRMTGWFAREDWPGLEPAQDYPHIIGHSSTRNVQYLMERHRLRVDPRALTAATLHAVSWTIRAAPHSERVAEARTTAQVLGLMPGVETALELLTDVAESDFTVLRPSFLGIAEKHPAQSLLDPANLVRAGLEVYYQRLHEMFMQIDRGDGRIVAQTVYQDARERAIEPLPGLAALLAIAKGWVGAQAAALAPVLAPGCSSEDAMRLGALGAFLEANPARVALVTSSAFYEAQIVLKEVFAGVRAEVEHWPLPESCRRRIVSGCQAPETYYDAMVTASDSHEFRLKPFRDLYSVALHTLGYTQAESAEVIGFEDTEAGILAQRAAGVGVCVAVPFEGTLTHNFQAASHVARGGLPEVLVKHALYLDPKALAPYRP